MLMSMLSILDGFMVGTPCDKGASPSFQWRSRGSGIRDGDAINSQWISELPGSHTLFQVLFQLMTHPQHLEAGDIIFFLQTREQRHGAAMELFRVTTGKWQN